MAITLVNPGGLPEIDVYRQVSIASGSKLVFVAGQVAGTPTASRSARETWPRRPSSATSTSPPRWRRPVPPSRTWPS